MTFNLSKIAAEVSNVPSSAVDIADDQADEQQANIDSLLTKDNLQAPPPAEQGEDTNVPPEVETVARNIAARDTWNIMQKELQRTSPEARGILIANPDYLELADTVEKFNPDSFNLTKEQLAQANEVANNRMMAEFENKLRQFRSQAANIQELHRQQLELQQNKPAISTRAFNLKKVKAQFAPSGYINEQSEKDFILKYIDQLMQYDGKKGQNDSASEQASQEILQQVSPVLQNDARDAIKSVQSSNNRNQAIEFLTDLYRNFIAPGTTQPGMEQVAMSDKAPKGIIKFNLSDHILNNKDTGMQKTAADQFGQSYMLYGPTEKRICPKLRGKNMGDFVSEYICRHHCLDGIVIDDNKTVCGEALWRAHAMDKFSREYVNADGEIVGGYLNKRFEINRNVPEENKMRLKPGETRKPRPPEWGSLESRMQAMRNKEGEKRGYRPTTDTSEPFRWCTDVDQNNVEVTQAERDKREEASGHQLVEYTEKSNQENEPKQPKKGFNLHRVKTAQHPTFEQEVYNKEDHAARLREASDNQLEFMLKDLNEVISIQEEGERSQSMQTPKLGYYYDERFAVLEEMKRRGIRPKPLAAPTPVEDGRPIEPQEQEIRPMASKTAFNLKKLAKSPPGFEHTVEHMKEKHKDIDNPFALAWWMKNQGYESHKTGKNKDECDDDSKDSEKKADTTFADAYRDAYIPENECGGIAPHGYVGSKKKNITAAAPATTAAPTPSTNKYINTSITPEVATQNLLRDVPTGDKKILEMGQWLTSGKLPTGEILTPQQQQYITDVVRIYRERRPTYMSQPGQRRQRISPGQLGGNVSALMNAEQPAGAAGAAAALGGMAARWVGQGAADVARGIGQAWNEGRDYLQRRRLNRIPTQQTAPAAMTPPATASLKPFNLKKAQCGCPHAMQFQPEILHMFNNDENEFLDFIESLNDQELRIILNNQNDTKLILRLKESVLSDIENTCKDLEIEG